MTTISFKLATLSANQHVLFTAGDANTQAKDDALAALDGNFGEMFGFDDELDDNDTYKIFNDPQPVLVALNKLTLYNNESRISLHSFARTQAYLDSC